METDFEFDMSPDMLPDAEATTAETQQPTKYNYNLRNWFYDLHDNDESPLIHAVYNTNNPTKIKVLCEYRKRFLVLNVLHDLVSTITNTFPAAAIPTYFKYQDTHPFSVDKFPKVDPRCGSYTNELTGYMTNNPQSAPDERESQPPQPPPTNKRRHNGEPVATSYVAAAGGNNTNPDLLA